MVAAPIVVPAPLHRLRTLALRAAAFNGDRKPTQILVYRSRRGTANDAVSGAGVNSNQPVFVVVVRGDFTAYGASPPAGRALPRGRLIVGVYDARTLRLTDWGIANELAHPALLGRPIALRP